MELKDKIQTAHSLIGIMAIMIGAWWTYDNFIKERRLFPHGNIENTITSIPLTPDINLLRVALKVTNTGTSRMVIVKTDVRIQQILPILPCAKPQTPCVKEQINNAMKKPLRQEDRFTWPVIGVRQNILETPLDIEPGEVEFMDFEFAIPSDVKAIRAYCYIRNESKTSGNYETGWHMSSFYRLTSKGGKYD